MAEKTMPVKSAPVAPSRADADLPDGDIHDAQIVALEAKIERLEKLLVSGAVETLEVQRSRDREAWYEAQAKEISKGNVVRTQEACDKKFPNGAHKFRCLLEDGNRHPEVIVRADNEVDAKARYLSICGINSHNHEKPFAVERV